MVMEMVVMVVVIVVAMVGLWRLGNDRGETVK